MEADPRLETTAVKRWNEFYGELTGKHGFAKKVVLEGMSRGGLIIYNWAAANPDKVAAMYGDAPVMDLKSWPGAGNGGVHKAYGFSCCSGREGGNPRLSGTVLRRS